MPKYLLFFLFVCISSFSFSQNIQINGYLHDEKTGERLINASVYEPHLQIGTFTNQAGFYSLSLPAKMQVEIFAASVGYQTKSISFQSEKDTLISFTLSPSAPTDTVEIKENRFQKANEVGVLQLSTQTLKELPMIWGEADILKAFQLLPGVKGGIEGTTGMYVRGGSPDQNLILLDDIPLYYVNHLQGLVSIFDANAIQNVQLWKGAFPARYGGRLSSVLDIQLKEGNKQHKTGKIGTGMLATYCSMSYPILKDKSALQITGRISTLGLLSVPLTTLVSGGKTTQGYNFYDFSAKYHHAFSAKDRIAASVYWGNDNLLIRSRLKKEIPADSIGEKRARTSLSQGGLGWKNRLYALKWQHLYNSKLFHNINFAYTQFQYYVRQNEKITYSPTIFDSLNTESQLNLSSSIKDIHLKADWDYFFSANHQIKWGGFSIFHTFSPNVSTFKETILDTTQVGSANISPIHSLESALYLEDEMQLGLRWKVNVGLHFSHYWVRQKSYFSAQPRLILNYKATEKLSFNASFNTMRQYLHLLSTSVVNAPSDLWVPPTQNIPPQNALQTSLGCIYAPSPKFRFTVDAFYKKMTNLITYKAGTSWNGSQLNWEEKVERNGVGQVYGLEFLAQKTTGKLTGWLSYSLSYNTRQFENLNNGKPYFDNYDRRHDVALVAQYQFTPHLKLSADWLFNSGRPITLMKTTYEIPNFEVGNTGFSSNLNWGLIYNDKNGQRLPAYHRLDVNLLWTKQKAKGVRTWTFGILNVYNHFNPTYYYLAVKNGDVKLYGTSILPILPSVGYSWEW